MVGPSWARGASFLLAGIGCSPPNLGWEGSHGVGGREGTLSWPVLLEGLHPQLMILPTSFLPDSCENITIPCTMCVVSNIISTHPMTGTYRLKVYSFLSWKSPSPLDSFHFTDLDKVRVNWTLLAPILVKSESTEFYSTVPILVKSEFTGFY